MGSERETYGAPVAVVMLFAIATICCCPALILFLQGAK